MSIPRKLLIIGKVWPEPDSSAAGSRMLQLINCFQQEGWAVTFASAANHSDYEFDLSSLQVDTEQIQMNDSSFDAWVKGLSPSAVLFDRFMTEEQFGWRVADQCPDAMRILDTEDLHFLRAGRHQAVKEERDFEEADLFNETAHREIASILRCDLGLIISESEMEVLKHIFKVDAGLLHYIPFLIDEKEFSASSWNSFEDREHFVSIGNFLHEPNRDAVRLLKEKIWPAIRKQLPEARLHIYGAYPPQKMKQLHNEGEGFIIGGRAGDAGEVLSTARILLAPVRFGAGLKGKLLDAMMNGTPSITTRVGAEGMHGSLEWPGSIQDDPERIAQEAAALYKDEESWYSAQRKIPALLKSRFRGPDHQPALMKRVHEVLDQLKEHRQKNFLGGMLMHHSLSSSRFMGKWIEEKNRKS